MKLEESIEVASCGSIMEYGLPIGHQTQNNPKAQQLNKRRDQREGEQAISSSGCGDTNLTGAEPNGEKQPMTTKAAMVVTGSEERKDLATSFSSKIERYRPRLSDRRYTLSTRTTKHHRKHDHDYRQQQQPQESQRAFPDGQSASHETNLLLHINHNLSNHLGEFHFVNQETGELNQQHHHHNHQSQALAKAGLDYMTSPAILAAQAVRDQHQRRREILEQFASLHSLSAVATAIQQSNNTFLTQHPQQFDQLVHLQQQQHNSQQLQFSLANLTLNNQHNFSSPSLTPNCVPSSIQVASSSCATSIGSGGGSMPSMEMPMDLHQKPIDAGPSVSSNSSQLALIDMVRRGVLLPQLNQTGIGQSCSPFDRLHHKPQTSDGSCTRGSLLRPSTTHSGGIRIGRRRGSRKCRKIYGMAQRQLWCTQCKWKKACSRFFCANQLGGHQHSASGSNFAAAIQGESRASSSGDPAANYCGPSLASMV